MLPEPLGVLAGTVIGVIFVVAGAAKLSSLQRWRASAVAMGSPGLLAVAVPWMELALGAMVAARVAIPWSALGIVVMLVAFTALIARHLLKGYRPGCGCFGERSSVPLSGRHLVRNGVFLVLAVAAALG